MSTRRLIRTDGTETELAKPHNMRQIATLIGAQTLDNFSLCNKEMQVVVVDDNGIEKDLPVNEKATALYHSICKPGTTHQIRGDVVVVPDSDFGI